MKKEKGQGIKIFASVVIIILCVVLIGSIIKISFGGSSFTFAGFLDYISNVPQISIKNIKIFSIGGDWGIIDGLREFLNSIMSIANFGVWFSSQLINGLVYIFYFVKFLLVV